MFIGQPFWKNGGGGSARGVADRLIHAVDFGWLPALDLAGVGYCLVAVLGLGWVLIAQMRDTREDAVLLMRNFTAR